MADAAVEFLLQNLKNLLLHHVELIKDVHEQVVQLETNFEFFISFLMKVSTKKQRKDDTIKALVRDIRAVVYEAEDIIDAVVTQAAENKTKTYFSCLINPCALAYVAVQVEDICRRIKEIYSSKDKFELINLAANYGDDEDPLQVAFSIFITVG